jgi:hypothetical protein
MQRGGFTAPALKAQMTASKRRCALRAQRAGPVDAARRFAVARLGAAFCL